MLLDYFYSLTPRQFSNTMIGYRNKEEAAAKERWIMTRKVMYSCLSPYLPKTTRESDILEFPWDDLDQLSEAEKTAAIAEVQKVKDFWENYDNRKKPEC